jgi:hypothetical protein
MEDHQVEDQAGDLPASHAQDQGDHEEVRLEAGLAGSIRVEQHGQRGAGPAEAGDEGRPRRR